MAKQARTFSGEKVIKQIEAKGFEKVGDSFEGTYVGTKSATVTDKDGSRESTIVLLQPDEGDKYGVWANAILEEQIAQVKHGDYIRIKHVGLGKAKGKKQGAKLFEIEIAD